MSSKSSNRTVVALGLGGCAMAAGIWCAFTAWKQRSAPLGLCGVVLLLAAPLISAVVLLVRKEMPVNEAGPPAHLLIDTIGRTDLSLRVIQLARATIFIGLSYTVVMWFEQASGMIDAPVFVSAYTILCLVAAACSLPWLARQERQVRAHRETCRSQLAELRFGFG